MNIDSYPEQEFDNMGCSLGCLFSRPGGLKENVEAIKKLSFESKKVVNSTRKEQDSLLKSLDISDNLEKKMCRTEDNINNTSAAIEEISAKSEEIVTSAKTLLEI